MSASAFPEDEWAIKRMIAEDPPATVARYARWQVEDIFEQLLRHNLDPRRYQEPAIFKRADQEVDIDVASETGLGATYSDEELARYRDLYRLAFLDAWRNPATLAAIQEKRRRSAGVIFVCMR